MEAKKSSCKILPQWALNSGPHPFGSNDLPSELLRQVKLGISLNCLLLLLNGSERRALDPNGCGPGFNALRGKILLLEFFFISRSKACDANIVNLIVNIERRNGARIYEMI